LTGVTPTGAADFISRAGVFAFELQAASRPAASRSSPCPRSGRRNDRLETRDDFRLDSGFVRWHGEQDVIFLRHPLFTTISLSFVVPDSIICFTT
jgi:hypothetical protein